MGNPIDHDLLIRYLKHLDGLLGALQAQEHVGFEEVAPVRSEMAGFRARVSQATFLGPAARRLLEGLDLRIDDKHLEGSRKTPLLNLYAMIGGNSPLLRAWRAKKKEAIDAELARVREEIQSFTLISSS